MSQLNSIKDHLQSLEKCVFLKLASYVNNGMKTSSLKLILMMLLTCLAEFLLAFNTVDCCRFLLRYLINTTSFRRTRLTFNSRQLLQLQEVGNKEVFRQIADSVPRQSELCPTTVDKPLCLRVVMWPTMCGHIMKRCGCLSVRLSVCLSVTCHISKTKPDRAIVTMDHYIEVGCN